MNDSGDIPLTHTGTPDTRPCSIVSIIPNIGMSSCRGRAEAFARSLSSKLRTLGSQTNEEGTNAEDEPIINGSSGGGGGGDVGVGNTNTWMSAHESDQTVTDLQPLRHESDSFFDFDCELESPGSPVDECEYLRLIETASNTPHNSTAESGYACASAASSHSSSDGPYFDAAAPSAHHMVTTQQPTRNKLPVAELPEYVNALKLNGSNERLTNGIAEHEEASPAASPTAAEQQNTQEEVAVCANDLTQTLPTTGPDELLVAGHEAAGVSVQDQILKELHQQSNQFADSTAVIANSAVEQTTTTTTQTTTTTTDITISNGHNEDGEDLLKIEVTSGEAVIATPTTTEATTQDVVDATAPIGVANEYRKLSVDIDATQLEQAKQDIKAAEESQAKSGKTRHSIDTTDDEDDCRPQRIRRCSSLKTGKTPPGTPGRKKIVRFADVLGLDLADIKTFLDEVPTIPKSAFEDLEILESEPPLQLGPKSDKLLMPLFQQPGGLPTFLDAVREKQVSLENAAVTDNINQTINGSVRVRNLDFHKSVHIRYTLDGWRSFADLQANYVENSCDGFSDKFTFVIFGNSLHVGQRLEFAVRFQCKGQQFWDNNYGANYCFQCLPSSNHVANAATAAAQTNLPSHHAGDLVGMLSPVAGDAWCSSFY